MSIDWSQVEKLADDLESVPERLQAPFEKVVEKGALNVKNGMKADAHNSGHYRYFASSITYDRDGLEAEIGPDKGRTQGALGNILYFGTSNNAPVLDINGPLNREAPEFERQIQSIGGNPI